MRIKIKNKSVSDTLRLCAFAVRNLLFLLLCAAVVFSCKKENSGDCFKSTGDVSIEYRTLATFDTIQTDDNVNIFLTCDTFFEVKVEAGENLIPLIKTDVKNNTLCVRNDNKCNWVRSFKVPINVYVTMPSPGGIFNDGHATIKGLNTITDRTVVIKMSSSGDVDLKLDVPHLLTKLSASEGNLYLTGTCPFSEIFCIGTTIIYANDLITDKTYITTYGTGDMHVNTATQVGANIYWIGNVYYTGNAVETYAHYTSSGRLIKK